jgi:hypothetical protein
VVRGYLDRVLERVYYEGLDPLAVVAGQLLFCLQPVLLELHKVHAQAREVAGLLPLLLCLIIIIHNGRLPLRPRGHPLPGQTPASAMPDAADPFPGHPQSPPQTNPNQKRKAPNYQTILGITFVGRR